MSMTGGDPRSTSVWAAIALAGLAVFVLFVVRHGRLLIQDLREFGKSLDD
jgi:hypothetical protein